MKKEISLEGFFFAALSWQMFSSKSDIFVLVICLMVGRERQIERDGERESTGGDSGLEERSLGERDEEDVPDHSPNWLVLGYSLRINTSLLPVYFSLFPY